MNFAKRQQTVILTILFCAWTLPLMAGEALPNEFKQTLQQIRKQQERTEENLQRAKITPPTALADIFKKINADADALSQAYEKGPTDADKGTMRAFTKRLRQTRSQLYEIDRYANLSGEFRQANKAAREGEEFVAANAFATKAIDKKAGEILTSLDGGEPDSFQSEKRYLVMQYHRVILQAVMQNAAFESNHAAIRDTEIAKEFLAFYKPFLAERKEALGKLSAITEREELQEFYQQQSRPFQRISMWRTLLNLEQQLQAAREKNKNATDGPIFKEYESLLREEQALHRKVVEMQEKQVPQGQHHEHNRALNELRRKPHELSRLRNELRNALQGMQRLERQKEQMEVRMKELPEPVRKGMEEAFAKCRTEAETALLAGVKARREGKRVESLKALGKAKLANVRREFLMEQAELEQRLAKPTALMKKFRDKERFADRIKDFEKKAVELRKETEKILEARLLAQKIENRTELLELKQELTEEAAEKLEEEMGDRFDEMEDMVEDLMDDLEEAEDGEDRDDLEKEAAKIPLEDEIDDTEIF